ncbi:sigma 54-interacting transcriptional regulator [Candidatus Binatia bacterium]|jgi:transcriptional regulator with GAF, ATPase, and Fis domain|nr:sigma 54-interacting transcriptional regulator [Candidatus Binatia bacterium]
MMDRTGTGLGEPRFELLFELSRSFAETTTDLESLLRSVVARCRAIFGAESNVAIMLLDDESGDLYFPYADTDGHVHLQALRDVRIPVGEGISGAVLASGRPELVVDAHTDPRFDPAIERLLGVAVGSIIVAPLRMRDGVVGLMTVAQSRLGPRFDAQDLAFLESLASYVALAIDNARMYERMRAAEESLRVEVGALRADLERRDLFPEIIGTSTAIRDLIRLMESAAASQIAVLIEGETGTGKELVARGIHRASARGQGPFLAVNCGAFTPELLEAELFGHERGAFTGAERAHVGLFEALTGGSILLDEVGEMPPAMQVKLLRVLQQGEVIPVGATVGRRIDVRVISASNVSLEAELARGSFRADLFYRLAAFPIRVPPLRERRGDIPALVDHLLHRAVAEHDKQILGITPEARALLLECAWPGNVRQLRNEVQRAVALARPGDLIDVGDLSEAVRDVVPVAAHAEEPAAPGTRVAIDAASLRDARLAFEASYIGDVLEREGGNVSRAAAVLGISRVMLHKKLKQLGLR